MNFTEEDFYGNKQGTVLEDGEVNYNEQANQEGGGLHGSKLALAVLVTFVKTLMGLIGTLFYMVAVMVCVAPKSAIKVFEFVKLDNATLFCYEKIYQDEQTLASLYNLVQKSIENKDHQKTNKYINELQGKSDYVNFCIKVCDWHRGTRQAYFISNSSISKFNICVTLVHNEVKVTTRSSIVVRRSTLTTMLSVVSNPVI